MKCTIPFVDLQLQHQPIQQQLTHAIQAVIDRQDFVLGQTLTEFEQAFAKACGAEFAVGVGSETDAIALGLRACGIGEGDEVILPANAFVATVVGVLYSGAIPVFVDCDPETALIDLMAAEKAISRRTRAIVPVHLYGQMVSPTQLLNLARTYDLLVFEDATQAHLADREGYRAGSVGTVAAFGFDPTKNLGAMGDGGMVVTREEMVAETLRSLRNYGAPRPHYHTDCGINSRLDSIQAAVLATKLPHLCDWNQDRYQAAQQYDALLQPLVEYGIEPIRNVSGGGHAYHLYVIRLSAPCPIDRVLLQDKLTAIGIATEIHYPIPCHLQPAYHFLGYECGQFPQAEQLAQTVLSLPIYPGITCEQIHRVVAAIESIVKTAAAIELQPI